MTTTSTSIPRWTYACVLACAFFSLISLAYRYRAEQSNRAVAFAVEADNVELIGASEGLSLGKTLLKLKNSGYNTLVLNEEKVADLITSGQILMQTEPGKVRISGDKLTLQRVLRGLALRVPAKHLKTKLVGPIHVLEVAGLSPAYVAQTAIGLNPLQAKAARLTGFVIIARCGNPTGATKETVVETITWARELGALVFVPLGDQVLGRRDLLKTMSDTLEESKMLYASPEFSKIGGDAEMLDLNPKICVRLHSAQNLEIDKMNYPSFIDRYAQAGSERDVRILLIRPFAGATESPVDSLATIAKDLSKELTVGKPHAYNDPGVWKPFLVLLALSIGGVVLGLLHILPWLKRDEVRFATAGFLVLLAIGCWSPSLRTYMALLGAIAMPIVAFQLMDERSGKSVVLEFLILSGVSLVGGLCVAGMLNMAPYFIRAQQFSGVKVAQFLPLVLIALMFLLRYGQTKGLSKAPVLWGQVIIGVVALAALTVMMMRSGNDNPAGVSGIELKLRSLLAHLCSVRPRSKEIFIGHPLMIVALGMLLRYKREGASDKAMGGWIALALAGGAIGQTSIVNTLCHLHTPLTVGITRIVVGLVLGGGIGIIALKLIEQIWKQPEPELAPVEVEGEA